MDQMDGLDLRNGGGKMRKNNCYRMDNSHGTQKMEVWKMNFLFNWVMFRFYVNFPVCTGGLDLLMFVPEGLFSTGMVFVNS